MVPVVASIILAYNTSSLKGSPHHLKTFPRSTDDLPSETYRDIVRQDDTYQGKAIFQSNEE